MHAHSIPHVATYLFFHELKRALAWMVTADIEGIGLPLYASQTVDFFGQRRNGPEGEFLEMLIITGFMGMLYRPCMSL